MKKLLTILLALALVTSALGLSAFAGTPHDGKAAITFEKGDLVIDPENPTDPTHPLHNIGARSMIFKTFKITGDNAKHTVLTTDGTVLAPNQNVGLIVTDARGEAGATWTISVESSVFNAGVNPSLGNYTLTLTNFGNPVAGTTPAGATPVPKAGSHILTAGAVVELIKSAAAGSPGKWGMEYTPELATIGGTEVIGKNEATVRWTVALT